MQYDGLFSINHKIEMDFSFPLCVNKYVFLNMKGYHTLICFQCEVLMNISNTKIMDSYVIDKLMIMLNKIPIIAMELIKY